jgi:hypothetical protein
MPASRSRELARAHRHSLRAAPNPFEAMQNRDACVERRER